MKNVGNSSDGRSQGVPKISGHPCVGRMGPLRGHLCDSTAFLSYLTVQLWLGHKTGFLQLFDIIMKKNLAAKAGK